MKYTDKMSLAFLSVILGDGNINKAGYSSISHSVKQKEFLEWKHKYLKTMGVPVTDIKPFNNNGYPAYRFYIRVTEYSKYFRHYLYKDGYKNFYKRELLEHLTAKHIAILYMDDGSLSQKKSKEGEIVANDITINTYESKEDNEILISYFKDVWNVNFGLSYSKGKYRIRCGTKEARKFIKLVQPFVYEVECMRYKLKVRPERA